MDSVSIKLKLLVCLARIGVNTPETMSSNSGSTFSMHSLWILRPWNRAMPSSESSRNSSSKATTASQCHCRIEHRAARASFVAQRHQRIYASGTLCGQIAGEPSQVVEFGNSLLYHLCEALYLFRRIAGSTESIANLLWRKLRQ
jgi:hypothetical protein